MQLQRRRLGRLNGWLVGWLMAALNCTATHMHSDAHVDEGGVEQVWRGAAPVRSATAPLVQTLTSVDCAVCCALFEWTNDGIGRLLLCVQV